MIVDRFENWERYFRGKIGNFVLNYIQGLKENSPDTDMEFIYKEDIKARVMSYTTKEISEAIFESHKKFIDVQFSLSGEEGIGWLPESMAQVKTEYDIKKDVRFYNVDVSKINVIQNVPGQFMVLFPGEVHGAGICFHNKPITVKKGVVKINWEAFIHSELG
ncbi:MAG: YhcH/YjgK/YiaL family protein [Candidatus Hydrogenedens sp.]